ncbi:MAG: AAA family ATPase [Clostridia bacterium]|nr:AAA family ATPase [Clostridia bacterium]
MTIEKIHIKSFGMITDMSLDFSDDINVFVGRNEAGKSTVAAFIKYMLYGFPVESSGDAPDERSKRINWESGIAEGSMTVKVGEKRYLINRMTERIEAAQRVSYKEDSSIIDLETGSPAFGKVAAGEVFFGVDRDLFDNTAFIGQIGDSSINEGSVRSSIENILFSGSEKINNQRAASKVSARMESLMHKSGMGGTIYELERRSHQLRERFDQADEDNKQILAMETKLHEIRSQRQNESQLHERLCDLDLCYRNVATIQNFDKLHDLEKRYDEKTEQYNAYVLEHTRADFVPNESYVTGLAVARRGVDDAYRSLVASRERYEAEKNAVGITKDTEAQIELSDSLGGESEALKKANGLKAAIIKNAALAVLLSLVFVGAAVFLLAFSAIMGIKIAAGVLGALALVGTLYCGYSIVRSKKDLLEIANGFSTDNMVDLRTKLEVIAEDRAKRDKMIKDTEDARLALESAKERYEEARGELLELILRWGEEPPTTSLNSFLDSLEARVREFLDGERAIAREKDALEVAIRESRALLADKSEIEIRGQVSPLKRKVLTQVNHDQIVSGIEDCKNKIADLDKQAATVEEELALRKLRATDPGELYAKMQETDRRIVELKKQHEAAKIALAEIENASLNLRGEISPRLGKFTASLMEIMTDKKYSDIDVSDGLKVTFTSRTGEKRSVDFLSGGTRDLTYISLRMALIDMLYTEKPPTLFDESFAHQDNSRAKAMMKAIKSLAGDGQQSFIFTCREREAALAKEVSSKAEVFKLSLSEEDVI